MNNYIRILEIKNTDHIKLDYKIFLTGILLALSIVISFISLAITKMIGIVYGIDCSYFIVIVALYLIGYRFTFIMVAIHSLLIILISGSFVSGLVNMTSSILMITSWFALTKLCFFKHNYQNGYHHVMVTKLVLVIIGTALASAFIMTLANLCIFYPLIGAGSIIREPAILWSNFMTSTFMSSINIALFLLFMPIIKDIWRRF